LRKAAAPQLKERLAKLHLDEAEAGTPLLFSLLVFMPFVLFV
jgi:hypothetical protein